MTQNKGDNWVRVFQVNDPRRHKNGFTIYKVTSVVFPKNAPEAVTNIIVWKRFKDFKKLHNSLKVQKQNYNITEELPKLSRSKKFRFEEELIQGRIKCALELLNFIGKHPPLFTCVPFLQFFNTSYQFSDTISDYVNSSLRNNNGDVSDSTSDLCNMTFMEKSQIYGNMKKENRFLDERSQNDSVSTYSLSLSSDEEILPKSDGTETLPSQSVTETKEEISLDNAKYQPDVELWRNNYETEVKKKLDGEESDLNMAKSLTSLPDHVVGETVTCRIEKPITDSEIWVCVQAQDFGSNSHSVLPSPPTSEEPGYFPAEDYLVEAGYHIGQAKKCEIVGEYESAFAFYKAAMACLLSGLSEDECKERRIAVQEKIKHYAQRAENVYALHQSKKKEEETILTCSEGLSVYKVLSIIDKVLLVLDTTDDKRYVIKVLEKSPCPVDSKKKTILPHNVPYMVKLVKYFENENSIFLVLQYASGGKLWDYVERCFKSHRDSVSSENEPEMEEKSVESVEESPVEEVNEKSYFELLKDYTTYTAKRVLGYYGNERETNAEQPETNLALTEASNGCINGENLEVSYLVKNSQRLLESIQNTLEQSDYVTDSLTKDLDDIETALEKEMPDKSDDKDLLDCMNKKRSKSVARSRFERRFSSEDVLESKSRTASSSLDRSGQWSRLAAMLESAPVLSEATVREWAAEMFVALETLHRWGVTCRDLHPGNILLDEKGHLLLTFQLHWRGVDSSLCEEAVTGLYAAPETMKIFPVTPAADWWSYGALLFQLLTGKSLSSCYPSGILSHTILTFPEFLSPEACSLLTELLRYEPTERLGGGINGSDDIKCHAFFNSIDWQLVYEK